MGSGLYDKLFLGGIYRLASQIRTFISTEWIGMNDMTPIQKTPLERFSAGEISRIDLGKLLGEPISFGDMLMMLHAEKLPLPRYGRPFNPKGIELIRQLASRNVDG